MDWRDDAACGGHEDPELWFATDADGIWAARRVCAGCPVIVECLEWALPYSNLDGVWGGKDVKQRANIRRQRHMRPRYFVPIPDPRPPAAAPEPRVPGGDNAARQAAADAHWSNPDAVCFRGHRVGDNAYKQPGGRWRCRACATQLNRESRARRRAARNNEEGAA